MKFDASSWVNRHRDDYLTRIELSQTVLLHYNIKKKGHLISFSELHLYICEILRMELYKKEMSKETLRLTFDQIEKPNKERCKLECFYWRDTNGRENRLSVLTDRRKLELWERHGKKILFSVRISVKYVDTKDKRAYYRIRKGVTDKLKNADWSQDDGHTFVKTDSLYDCCSSVYNLIHDFGCVDDDGPRINTIRLHLVSCDDKRAAIPVGQSFLFMAPNCSKMLVNYVMATSR